MTRAAFETIPSVNTSTVSRAHCMRVLQKLIPKYTLEERPVLRGKPIFIWNAHSRRWLFVCYHGYCLANSVTSKLCLRASKAVLLSIYQTRGKRL